MTKKKLDLKANLEKQLSGMLDAEKEPSEGRMKLIALGIKMCALNAKLEESTFGEFFDDADDNGTGSTGRGDAASRVSKRSKVEGDRGEGSPAGVLDLDIPATPH